MGYKMKKLLLNVIASLLLIAANLAIGETLLHIEAPAEEATVQGVATIRGYALATDPIVALRYRIDDKEWQPLPYGAMRGDIDSVFYGRYHDTLYSGFSTTTSWNLVDPDVPHTLTVQMLTQSGQFDEATTSFWTTRFNPLDGWWKAVSLEFADFYATENGFALNNVRVGETLYPEIRFEWNNKTQNFTIEEIR